MYSAAKVSGLWIYPVKSCRGISLKEMQIGAAGPVHDRQWMLVDERNQFITRRTEPRLAEIITSIQESELHLYLGLNKIQIDHTKDCEKIETVTVWKDSFLAGIEKKEINEAISDFLKISIKLARYQKESFRYLNLAATTAVKQTMFADSMPILLTNENSLKDLNLKLSKPSSMDRFRANIIIEGLGAYEEDNIAQLQIGEIKFQNPKLCARCPVVTQDAETGKVVSKETLSVLSAYRKIDGNKVVFGVNLTPANVGIVRLGDLVQTK